jgi:hypothetical protein
MTAQAVVAETAPPLKHTTALAGKLRQTSGATCAGACAGASAGAGALTERLRQNGDRIVLMEMKEKEEEELSTAKDVYRRIVGLIALCCCWWWHHRPQVTLSVGYRLYISSQQWYRGSSMRAMRSERLGHRAAARVCGCPKP